MPSWGRSFVVAFKAWIVGILLSLVFTTIFGFLGYTMIYGALEVLSYEPYIQINYGAAALGIILILIGTLLASLSAYVALVKYTVEESVKEAGLRAPPPILPPAAPTGICSQCGKPVTPEAKFCVHCGAKLTST